MKYEEVKTPEELLKFMSENLTYGFTSPDGEIYTPEDDERYKYGVLNLWKLSSPERLVEVGHGYCFDQVELERDWFTKNGYKYRTFFIWFELEYKNPFLRLFKSTISSLFLFVIIITRNLCEEISFYFTDILNKMLKTKNIYDTINSVMTMTAVRVGHIKKINPNVLIFVASLSVNLEI